MSKKNVIVRVDWREERGTSVLEVAEGHDEVEDVALVELDVGDMEIREKNGEGAVLFERKSVSDFANSMMDEDDHMRDQVERLEEATGDSPRVLIEGNMEDFESLRHSRVKAKSLRGFTASLEERNGARVKFCSDLDTLVDYAIRASRKQFESQSESLRIRSSVEKKSSPVAMRMYGCLDGVGAKTAQALHKSFPTVKDIFDAEIEDLIEVDGIGEKRAEEIYTSLRTSK